MADRSPLPFPSPSTLLGESPPDSKPASAAASSLAAGSAAPRTNLSKDKAHARRPSNGKKKAAGPRKAPAIEVKDASVVKPKQTKSRNGCHTCKTKRLKCGEEKPGCQNCERTFPSFPNPRLGRVGTLRACSELALCINADPPSPGAKRGVACGGYKKVYQWRDFNDQNVKLNPERPQPKQSTSNFSPLKVTSAGSSQAGTPVTEVPPILSRVSTGATEVEGSTSPAPRRPHLQRARSDSPHTHLGPSLEDDAFATSPREYPEPAPPQSKEDRRPSTHDEFSSVSFTPHQMFAFRSRSLSPSTSRNTPTFTDILLSQHLTEENGAQQDFVPFSMPEGMHLPMWSTLGDDHGMNEADFLDDDLTALSDDRNDDMIFEWPEQFNTVVRSNDSSPPTNMIPFWNDAMSDVYAHPAIPVDSPEALGLRYQQVTAGNLSIMDGPSENPWRTIVWPMAQTSAALWHAVLAMTAFNLARDDPQFRIVGQEHKGLSIKNINEGIRDGTMTELTALATALALGFSEAWDEPTTTGNVHIKGAQILVKRALERHRQDPREGLELKKLKFLCNAWVYMDVISRLTSVDSDEGTDFDSMQIFEADSPRMPSMVRMASIERPGFGINFGMPIDARLDPLMGCAGTLFPIIGRVANLVRKVCRSNHNSPGIVSRGRDLKRMLEDWDPPEEVESPEDPTTGVENARQTAEAYRWATLLHLHQAVPELPSLSSVELAQRAMAAVATVPLESRTTIVQIYPLMVAGCEQTDEEDRQWVRERWQAMMERMRIGIIDKCMAVTNEVWRRRDAYEAKPVTQRKLVRTAELRAARRSHEREERSTTHGPGPEPGRCGMIFSYVTNDSEAAALQLKDVNGPDTIRRRKGAADRVTVDPAYSVRGPIHWIGVMWEWSWEVLLG